MHFEVPTPLLKAESKPGSSQLGEGLSKDLGKTPNVDLVFLPTSVSCKSKFLVPECEVGFEEKRLGLSKLGYGIREVGIASNSCFRHCAKQPQKKA